MMHRFACALCNLAGLVLPPARKPWGDIMKAELAYLKGDRSALIYAGGCLSAAVQERARDFDTRFAAGLWSLAMITGLFAVQQFACAMRGVRVLRGAPDAMHDALVRSAGDPLLIARYEAARPVVIGCFFALGAALLMAAWFLSRNELRRFLTCWCVALLIAAVAVAIQLSIVWSIDGLPSEFHALILQAAGLAALLGWSNGRHRPFESQI